MMAPFSAHGFHGHGATTARRSFDEAADAPRGANR